MGTLLERSEGGPTIELVEVEDFLGVTLWTLQVHREWGEGERAILDANQDPVGRYGRSAVFNPNRHGKVVSRELLVVHIELIIVEMIHLHDVAERVVSEGTDATLQQQT